MYHYYILLLDLLLLVITILSLHCYHNIITHYYIIHYYVLLLFLLLCCCCIIIIYNCSIRYYALLLYLLLHCYYIIITYYYIFIITYYYNIIITYYYIIITSLLHHYYIIITSLFPIAKTGNNELIITYYALSLFSLLHCYYPLLLLLPIITCYQLGNLQMTLTFTCICARLLSWREERERQNNRALWLSPAACQDNWCIALPQPVHGSAASSPPQPSESPCLPICSHWLRRRATLYNLCSLLPPSPAPPCPSQHSGYKPAFFPMMKKPVCVCVWGGPGPGFPASVSQRSLA